VNTKHIIIEKTIDVLLEKGFHGTRLDEILKYSQVSKGSLYYYFPKGKKELCIECLRLYTIKLSLQYKKIFKESNLLGEGLIKIIENSKFNLENSCFKTGSLLVNISQEIDSNQKDLQEICKDLFELILHTFENFFLEYRFKKWQQAARIFVLKLNGAIILSKACKNTIFLEDLKNEYSNIR
tara:strand:+ start:391 stop:936 length:546 start_codon:yes stop_codon:yes gene_type:complete